MGLAVIAAQSLGVVAGAYRGSAGRRPTISLHRPLPNVVRIGEQLTVNGDVRTPPPDARVALESAHGTGWRVLATNRLGRDGAFSLRWQVPKGTPFVPIKLRVVVRRNRIVLAATPATESFVGSAPVYCNPPTRPGNVPDGSGWIVGGLYIVGGPAPGIIECSGQPYAVAAINSSGVVAAKETVPANGSYTLILPAGSYTLESGCGRGMAIVKVGKQTHADTICDVP